MTNPRFFLSAPVGWWVPLFVLVTHCGSREPTDGDSAGARIDNHSSTPIPSESSTDPTVVDGSDNDVLPDAMVRDASIEDASLRFVALTTGGGTCRDANGAPIDADCSYTIRVEGSDLTYRSVAGEESMFELTPDESSTVEALGDEVALRTAVEGFAAGDCADTPGGSTAMEIAWTNSIAFELKPVGTCIEENSDHPLRAIAATVWELKLRYVGLTL
jgi:hypothetical protein